MAKKSLAMKIENVSMKFNLSSEKVDNIKEYVIKMIKKEPVPVSQIIGFKFLEGNSVKKI